MDSKEMTLQQMEQRIVRYGELIPCKTAFIDAHTPGSELKENFTIIGGGVSESPDQHVHINETPGFNIGAAGQAPKCVNSLHTHRTAEVFFILKGRWRFFWGRYGNAGEVVLEEGDLINIPTHLFRGFENIGTDYGMIMAVLGGDDAGGGVLWAPEVIQKATEHGLILAETGQLYDSKKGQSLPEGIQAMPIMTQDQLAEIHEAPASAIVPKRIARYQDMMALANNAPADVISAKGLIKDKPGFSIDLINHNTSLDQYNTDKHEILMVMHGHWRLTWAGGETVLAPGDVCAVPPELNRTLKPSMTGEASLFRVRNTDDLASATDWNSL